MSQQKPLRFRGRILTDADVASLREIIAAHPGASRRMLSRLVCEAWNWRQPNGRLKDMVCRGMMLLLHRAGAITLPEVRVRPPNNVIKHRLAAPVLVDQSPITGTVADLGPIEIHQVRRSEDERLFNGLILQNHYLAYTRPVGEHFKYLAFSKCRPIAGFAWSSPPRHLKPRDRFIGWSMAARMRNLTRIAYNTRFLILPWVRVPHLASHLLGRMARRLSSDFEVAYGHPVYYLETFIDPARFKGTCYRAANWHFLGQTTGRGHNARTSARTQPKKEVLGLPLVARFREILGDIG